MCLCLVCTLLRSQVPEVRTAIQQDEEHEYNNGDGEQVKWVLDEIIQIDEVEKLSSGDEVVGFICNEGEFIKKTPENLIENIRRQYESEKSELIPVIQVQKDISVLVNEIARLKAFFNLT